MNISPTDVRQQQFETKFRGCDPEEVRNYLELVARELEELSRKNIEFKEELEKSRDELTDYKKNDMSFRRIIGAAQEFKDDVTGRASKEAELILRQAETKAGELIKNAKEKVFTIERGISEMKAQKRQFEISLRSLIENHLRMINTMTMNGREGVAPPSRGGNTKLIKNQ